MILCVVSMYEEIDSIFYRDMLFRLLHDFSNDIHVIHNLFDIYQNNYHQDKITEQDKKKLLGDLSSSISNMYIILNILKMISSFSDELLDKKSILESISNIFSMNNLSYDISYHNEKSSVQKDFDIKYIKYVKFLHIFVLLLVLSILEQKYYIKFLKSNLRILSLF